MMWRGAIVLWCLIQPALAEAPDASLFPRPRPVVDAPVAEVPIAEVPVAEISVAEVPATAVPEAAVDAAAQAALDAVASAATLEPAPAAPVAGNALTTSPYPRARPVVPEASVAAAPAIEPAAEPVPEAEAEPARRGLLAGLFGAPRPRPDRTAIAAAPAARGNGICGNPLLTGQSVPAIQSRTNGCGVEDPVQISAVDGIQLSQPATMDCTTANALARWVDEGLRPAFGDEQVVGLQVAGHYICRTRNHRPGARISEHGRGKAIDISGIILAGGRVLTVASNWNRQMRAAHQAACGIFGTTLGPGSDGYHEDHMHFDTANHRNGPYCR